MSVKTILTNEEMFAKTPPTLTDEMLSNSPETLTDDEMFGGEEIAPKIRPQATALSPVAGEIKTVLTDEEMNAPEGIDIGGGITIKQPKLFSEKYLKYGQDAMKLFAIRPDVALGLSKDIEPEQLEMTKDRWADILKGTYPELKDPQSKLAQSTAAQFVVEMAGDLLEKGTKPSTYVLWGAMERVIPKVVMGAFKKLPKSAQQALLKERFAWGRQPIDLSYKELGLKPGASPEAVKQAYRAQAFRFHPDKAPAGQSVKYTREFIKKNTAYEKILGATKISREAAGMKSALPTEMHAGVPIKAEYIRQIINDLNKIDPNLTKSALSAMPVSQLQSLYKARIGKEPEVPDPLTTEAKKFKTASEFVGSQLGKRGELVFRGDTEKIDLAKYDLEKSMNENIKDLGSIFAEGPGVYLTTSEKTAGSFGKNVSERILPKDKFINNKTSPLSRGKIEKIVNSFDKKTLEIATSNWSEDFESGKQQIIDIIMKKNNAFDQLIDVWAEILYQQNPEEFVSVMTAQGIDGAMVQREGETHFVVYNKELLKEPKTKSQLTDIWKQAQAKPTDPLTQEAKKFKSAESFVEGQQLEIKRDLKSIGLSDKNIQLVLEGKKEQAIRNQLGSYKEKTGDLAELQIEELPDGTREAIVPEGPGKIYANIGQASHQQAIDRAFVEAIDNVENILSEYKTKSQLTDIWEKAQEVTAEAPITEPSKKIKDFTNFESKESPIGQLDKKINEVNGLRLSGKISAQEANQQTQLLKKQKLDYAKEKGIAITQTQRGKTRIAIRKSGFYAKKVIEDAPIVDAYSQFQAPSGMALMQDGYQLGGKFGTIYKEVWMPTKKSIVGSITSKSNFDNEFKGILKNHKFPITKKNGLLLSDWLEKKVTIPKRYEKLVNDIRGYMDTKRDLANEVRKTMGKSNIGYIENYVPHIQETSIWNELVGNDVTITDNFDFIIPNQIKNPFAYKRLLKEMARPERNFFSLVERYNSAIAKDIHINPAIENIKAYNTVLKDKGLFKASKYWDEYIRVGLLGKQHKIDNALSVSPVVRKGLKKWKDILNKAFLTGKISWNIATQPLSYISLTPTEAGYKNAIIAVSKMFNKGIRNVVREKSLSLQIKSKDILSDAIGEGRGYANRIYRTKIDKWNDFISIISSTEEQLLHQASYIAGLDKAKEFGYTGEDAHMFADLVAERSQSMYNKENRALILNSDITTAAVPFQSFAVEMSNHAKEILTKSKGAMRLNIRQRIGKLIRLIIGIWLGNQYAKALTGREKTTVGTFIPFAGETVDRLISKVTKKGYTSTRSPVSQVQQVENLVKASKDYLKYGDTQRLRKIGITFAPAVLGIGGGGQVSNMVDGIIADIEGEVKSASGTKLFSVKDIEGQIKAPIFGVWSTPGGREYWDKREKKKETESVSTKNPFLPSKKAKTTVGKNPFFP